MEGCIKIAWLIPVMIEEVAREQSGVPKHLAPRPAKATPPSWSFQAHRARRVQSGGKQVAWQRSKLPDPQSTKRYPGEKCVPSIATTAGANYALFLLFA